MTTFDELRRIPLFDGLSDTDLGEVLEQGLEKVVPAGEVNGREGEPVEHLYVILEGELRITKEVNGGEVVINTFTPGAFFAEVPLLAGTPFLATGRALTDCRMFLIPNDLFRRMLTEYPTFSNRILETMAERVQILQSVAGQRERLNALGTLAAGLAHQLNNPAAAARRSAEDLRESLEALRSQACGWHAQPPARSRCHRRSKGWNGPSATSSSVPRRGTQVASMSWSGATGRRNSASGWRTAASRRAVTWPPPSSRPGSRPRASNRSWNL